MANISNLKIYINPSLINGEVNKAVDENQINSYGKLAGYLLFDEVTQNIYVNGKSYGVTKEQADEIIALRQAITILNGEDTVAGSVDYKIKQIVIDKLGNLKGTLVGKEDEDKTVSELIGILHSEINTLTTDINGIKSGISGIEGRLGTLETQTGEAVGGVSGSLSTAQHVQVKVSSSGGKVTDVEVKETDIASASALSTYIHTINTKTGVNGSVTLEGKDTKVGNINAEGETASSYSTDSIAYAINNLKSDLDILSGGTASQEALTNLLNTIRAIEKELNDPSDASGISDSILDALAKLQVKTNPYYGIKDDGTTSSENIIPIQGSLENLQKYAKTYADNLGTNYDAKGSAQTAENNAKTYADSLKSGIEGEATDATSALTLHGLQNYISQVNTTASENHSEVTDGITGDAVVGANNYVTVTSSSTNGKTIYTIKTTQALEDIIEAAQKNISWVELPEVTA